MTSAERWALVSAITPTIQCTVLRFCAKRPGVRERQEDLIHEITLTLWEQAHKFDAERSTIQTWAQNIAPKRLLDILRRDPFDIGMSHIGGACRIRKGETNKLAREVANRRYTSELVWGEDGRPVELGDIIPTWPDDSVELRDEMRRLRHIKDLDIAYMHFGLEIPQKEIAESLKISCSRVCQRLHNFLAQCRAKKSNSRSPKSDSTPDKVCSSTHRRGSR